MYQSCSLVRVECAFPAARALNSNTVPAGGSSIQNELDGWKEAAFSA